MTEREIERDTASGRALTAMRREWVRRARRQQKIVTALMIIGTLSLVGGMVVFGERQSNRPTWAAVRKDRSLMQREAALVCQLLLRHESEVRDGRKSWLRVLIDVENVVLRQKNQYTAEGYEGVYLLFAIRDLRQYVQICEKRKEDFGMLLRGYAVEESVNENQLYYRDVMAVRYMNFGRQLYERESQKER